MLLFASVMACSAQHEAPSLLGITGYWWDGVAMHISIAMSYDWMALANCQLRRRLGLRVSCARADTG